jgi:hypothetical protein
VQLATITWLDLPDARDHALPCRPTIACTAEIVAPGTFEVEAGSLSRRSRALGDSWSTPLLLKQTVTPELQLQLGENGFTLARGKVRALYLDDVAIGPKIVLHRQTEALPALSVSGSLSIPTAAGRGYLRTYDAFFTGYITKDFGPIHADWNIGMNLWRLETSTRPQEFTALALSANLVAPFGIMAEGYVFSDATPVATRDGGFLFALSHSPRNWLVFDVGADIGFFPTTRSLSAFVGMTIIPVVLWR